MTIIADVIVAILLVTVISIPPRDAIFTGILEMNRKDDEYGKNKNEGEELDSKSEKRQELCTIAFISIMLS